MSQTPQPSTYVVARETNGLGLAGLIVSIIGIFTGGLLLPVGFILSIVAMLRGPRDGVTIAGFIVGLLLNCLGAIVIALFGTVILAAIGIGALALALAPKEQLELAGDMAMIAIAVEEYREEHDLVPPDFSVLSLDTATTTDPWGKAYSYHLSETAPGFEVTSAGADGAFGTDDDVLLSKLGESWKIDDAQWNATGSATATGGSSTVRFGNIEIISEGDDGSGRVIIRQGDRVMTIEGDEHGGSVRMGEDAGTETPPSGDSPNGDDSDDAAP